MAVGYQVMYRFGFTPWDNGVVPDELKGLIEGPRALRAGRALDLGCGTGTQSVYLASHGWRVVGVDIVEQALEQARKRADEAGVRVDWLRGDVSRLQELGIDAGIDLCYDAGCYHGLSSAQRSGYAHGVTMLARPGAVLLLLAFEPGFRGPAPRGASEAELRKGLGDKWVLAQVSQADLMLPALLRNAAPKWYWFNKK